MNKRTEVLQNICKAGRPVTKDFAENGCPEDYYQFSDGSFAFLAHYIGKRSDIAEIAKAADEFYSEHSGDITEFLHLVICVEREREDSNWHIIYMPETDEYFAGCEVATDCKGVKRAIAEAQG